MERMAMDGGAPAGGRGVESWPMPGENCRRLRLRLHEPIYDLELMIPEPGPFDFRFGVLISVDSNSSFRFPSSFRRAYLFRRAHVVVMAPPLVDNTSGGRATAAAKGTPRLGH